MQSPSVKVNEERNILLHALSEKRRRLFRYLPWLVLLICLAFTGYLWDLARQNAEREVHNYFDFRVRQAVELTEQRMMAQEQVLRGARGLFEASQNVERAEFRNYVASLHLEENYPGIQGVGFSLAIPPAQLEKHSAAIRKEGFPQYSVHPLGKRDLYTSIIYLEPFDWRNQRAFGFDMYSEPIRRAAMAQARDSGQISLSGKVKLVQETEKDVQAGFLIYLPIYRNGMPHDTLEERRASLVGWVYSPLRMNDFAHGIYGEQSADLDIEIYDGDAASPDALLYDSSHAHEQRTRLHTTRQLSFGGHTWIMQINAMPSLQSRVVNASPDNLILFGVAASLLLTWLAWLLITGRERALNAARQMNRELLASEGRYRMLVETSPFCIHEIGADGNFQSMNRAGLHMISLESEEAIRGTPFLDMIDQKDKERIGELMREALLGNPSQFEFTSNGNPPRLLKSGLIPLRNEQGEIQKLMGISEDITESRLAELALQKESEKNLALLHNASDGIHILDTEGNVIEASNSFCEMLGYSREEVIGMNVARWDASFSSSELTAALRRQFENPSRSQFETIHRRKDGALLNVEVSGFPLILDGKPVLFNSSRDITDRKQNEKALADAMAQTKRLSDALDHLDTYVYMKDLQHRYIYANKVTLRLFNCTAEELPGCDDTRFFPAETVAHLWQIDERVFNGENTREEVVVASGSGKRTVYLEIKTPLYDSAGKIIGLCGVSHDITDRKLAEETITRNEANMRAILDNIPYLVWLKDTDSRFVAVNQAFLRSIGKAGMEDVIGKTDFDLWPESLARKYREDDIDVMVRRLQKLTEEQAMDHGTISWVETFKAPILDRNGRLLGTTGFARDITERKLAQELVQHMAHHDALTDLPNRALFADRFQQALASARRDKSHLALMFIDLDKFKPINDELGHEVGDLLLKEVAWRMQHCVRESDTVARIGGDEFVVLLPVIVEVQDALHVGEKIRHALNQPFEISGRSLNISSSTGVAVYPEHGDTETELMKNADVAMYYAKQGGRNSVVLYAEGMTGNPGKQDS